MPASIEERVAYLKGKVEEHSKVWVDLKDLMVNHDSKMIAFEQRIDRLFEAIDRRFEAIDRRFEAIDQKFSKYFLWIIGLQISVLLAVRASMLR